MEELVKRLRELHPEEFGNAWDFAFACQQAMHEAADAIEELQKRVPKAPHGSLIDADALIEKVIAKYLEHERKGEFVFAAAEIKQDIVDLISNAPTIIEAEEGE